MEQQALNHQQNNHHLMNLVATALNQDELSGLSAMLKAIAMAMDAYGCVLWEVAPGADLAAQPPLGRLFVLAEWFREAPSLLMDDLPLQGSVPGEAVLRSQPQNIDNVQTDSRVFRSAAWLKESGVKVMCATPIRFRDVEMSLGAVSLYRKEPRPFTEEEVQKLGQLATLVPALYQAIRDKVSQNLIGAISEVLQQADLRAANAALTKEEMKQVFQQITELIAKTFQCLETSIYLEDKFDVPGEHQLMATTAPPPLTVEKGSYRAGEEGLTGWVLARHEPMSVFDLANLKRDRELIQGEYQGVTWNDKAIGDFLSKARRFLPASIVLPLSFIAAPIVRGEQVLGLIRCWGAMKSPYYFAKRELNLLKLVAAQISHFWSNWLIRRDIEEENRAWQEMVNSVSRLNSFVQRELIKEKPDERRIFVETLKVTDLVIGGADAMDVRLLDEQSKELCFTETYGKAWENSDPAVLENRLKRRFLLQDRSAGAHVYRTRKVYLVPDASNDEFYLNETFGTKRAIIAPVQVGQSFFGVLDIRGMGTREFPKHAMSMAELLGQQLGLYHYLTSIIGELHRAEDERVRTAEDLTHQLRSPLMQAYARVQELLQKTPSGGEQWARLAPIRGLCGKSKRVMMNTALLAELARENSLLLKASRLQRLQYEPLAKMLSETASDTEILIDPRRKISFNVNMTSFRVLYTNHVKADLDLLEQVVSCVLDNAGKYSFPETTVEIAGGVDHRGRFYISVTNKGLAIHHWEILLCTQRLWRGDYAQMVVGEGNGIGLWVVDNIMKAHRGELEIFPTTADKFTQVRLLFPIHK